MAIEFIHNLEVTHGKVEVLVPGLRRLIAPNMGPYTYTGTGTYIIGRGNVAVIDPGPLVPSHIDGIIEATKGETISHIVVTHTHIDHSPAALPLSETTGAPVLAFGPHGLGIGAGLENEEVEEGADKEFSPTQTLKDGEEIKGDGWTIRALHTPGHTSNHMCFHWLEEDTLFTGDHIMGWSTSVINPPDGDMAAYMASLTKLKKVGAKTLRPTHGPAIKNGHEFITSLIDHRLEREAQILEVVTKGASSLAEITLQVYTHIGPELIKAAERNTLAHLIYLVEQEKVETETPISSKGTFKGINP